MIEFLEEIAPAGSLGGGFVLGPSAPAPLHLARLPGEPARLVGVFAQPPHVVMGLRGWEDAHEGVLERETPWVLFEIEKIVRMALRQDGLALEILAASRVLASEDGFDARALARHAITSGVLAHYRDVTAAAVAGMEAGVEPAGPRVWRELLTGALLARDAVFGEGLDALLDAWGDAALTECVSSGGIAERARAARALHARLDPARACALPARPSDYDALDRAVVSWRMSRATS